MKVAVRGYNAGKAWLCICIRVEPPFSKSWIRHWKGNCDKLVSHSRVSGRKDAWTLLLTKGGSLPC